MVYTLLVSLPLLVILMYLNSIFGSLMIRIEGLVLGYLPGSLIDFLISLILVFAFLVKIPIFIFHL